MNTISTRALRVTLVAILAGAAVYSGPPSVASADWLGSEQQVTTTPYDKGAPDISGKRIVYADFRNAHDVTVPGGGDSLRLVDVRVLDTSTGTDRLLTPAHNLPSYEQPVVSGGLVAWIAYSKGLYRIWYRNLSTGISRKLPVTGDNHNLQIDGHRLCYERNDRVYVYDLKKQHETKIAAHASACQLSGVTVVWETWSAANGFDVRAYNLSTKVVTKVTDRVGSQELPRTDGTWVVYPDDLNGVTGYNVYAYNLKTHVQRLVRASIEYEPTPDVSAGRVVWEGDTGVALYDLATGVTTAVAAVGIDPRISGSRITWFRDVAGHSQFFLRRIIAPTLTAGAPAHVASGAAPAVSGSLSWNGVPVIGRSVTLQYSTNNRTWVTGATATTNLSGLFLLTGPAVTRTTWIRVRFSGDTAFAPALSATLKVRTP